MSEKALISIDLDKALELPKEEVQAFVADLEERLKGLPQTEIPLRHYFSKGVYGREIKFDKDALIIGKIHKHQTMNVISQGEVSVFSIDGCMRVKAPFTFVSSPGAKRVIYAHEETVWTCFHGTEETDVEKIEEEFIAKDYDDVVSLDGKDVLKLQEAKCLG